MNAIPQKQLTGRMVLAVFIGFFVVVFAANGIMTYLAIDTFSGVETDDAYRKGRDYNDTLAEARKQAALDWQATLNTVSLGGSRVAIDVDVSSKDGAPKAGTRVSVKLFRPTVQGMDTIYDVPETAPGLFATEVVVAAPGNWRAFVTVTDANGDIYKLEKKLFVKE